MPDKTGTQWQTIRNSYVWRQLLCQTIMLGCLDSVTGCSEISDNDLMYGDFDMLGKGGSRNYWHYLVYAYQSHAYSQSTCQQANHECNLFSMFKVKQNGVECSNKYQWDISKFIKLKITNTKIIYYEVVPVTLYNMLFCILIDPLITSEQDEVSPPWLPAWPGQ